MHIGLPETRRTLIIAPHPDDEVLGCGGTAALLARGGTAVRTVFVTGGERLHGEPSDEVAAERRREAIGAAEIMGAAEPVFLGLPDGGLAGHADRLHEALGRIITETGPDLVIAPSPVDHHADHLAASRAVLRLFDGSASFRLAFYEIYSTLRFTHLVDITDVIDQKKKAILSYRTSLYGKPDLFVSALLGLNSQRSLFVHRAGYFEALWVLDSPMPDEGIRDWITYGF